MLKIAYKLKNVKLLPRIKRYTEELHLTWLSKVKKRQDFHWVKYLENLKFPIKSGNVFRGEEKHPSLNSWIIFSPDYRKY